MTHKTLRPFIVKVSVLGYFPPYTPFQSLPIDIKKYNLPCKNQHMEY